jgi:predicted double-glycine peptidase
VQRGKRTRLNAHALSPGLAAQLLPRGDLLGYARNLWECARPGNWLAVARIEKMIRRLVWLLLILALSVAGAQAQPVKAPDQPVVRQRAAYDCGVAALAHLLSVHLQMPVDVRELEAALPGNAVTALRIRQQGYSLAQLGVMARHMGAEPRIAHISPAALSGWPLPALVHLQLETGSHFTVLSAAAGNYVVLADPSQGMLVWPNSQFLAAWAPQGVGYVMTLTADPAA